MATAKKTVKRASAGGAKRTTKTTASASRAGASRAGGTRKPAAKGAGNKAR